MKFSKWTLGLAAVGAVSMASAVRADEAKMSAVNTALSNTTISGVVDVGYSQQLGDVNPGGSLPSYGVGTDSRFSLNQVIISLDKPLDESAWASGYHIDLNFGPDTYYGSTDFNFSDYGIVRQAYVALRTPVGNGIDWKVGVFDGVTGYEGNTFSANPNYTRSYGFSLNPATYVGAIGSYKFTDLISAQAGFVNRGTVFGSSDAKRQAHDYIATLSLTAPASFGFLKGSTLNLQTVQGFDNESADIYSANVTLPTPVAGLKLGLAFDAYQSLAASEEGQVYGIYASYQATDKLGLALRGELVNNAKDQNNFLSRGSEVTATLSYNLWANVLSRLEARWDHLDQNVGGNDAYGSNGHYVNAFVLAANVAYKF